MPLNLHELHAHFSAIKAESDNWSGMRQQLCQYFVPPSATFNSNFSKQGGVLHNTKAYDDVPAWAANTLASALLGMIANPMNKWLDFGLVSNNLEQDEEVRDYFQQARDIILHIIQLPDVGMYIKLHQMLLEYVIFGQSVMLVTKDPDTGLPNFRPCPLQECYFILDSDQHPDVVFREFKMTARTICDKWPDAVSQAFLDRAEKAPHNEVMIYHAVFPRKTTGFSQFAVKKPWASIHYMDSEGLTLLSESGFDKFPYLIPVWQRFSGETQGRGPGVFALPSVRLLNQIIKDSLKASQTMIDPPKILNRRGWLGKIANYPGGIMFADGLDMDQLWRPFGNNGSPEMGLEWAQKFTQQIERIFFLDKIHSPQKNAELREVEVIQDQEERMRDMVPQLANLHVTLSQMIDLVVHYCKDFLPEPPPQLVGADVQIKYMSPLARAQKVMAVTSMNRTMNQFIFPLASLDQSVLQKIHTGKLVDYIFEETDIPVEVTRTNAELDDMKAKSQEQADAQMAIENAEKMSAIAKNLKGTQAEAGGALPGLAA